MNRSHSTGDYKYGDSLPEDDRSRVQSGLLLGGNLAAGSHPISIRDDGGDIVETDYFESSLARVGMIIISFNAGVARLLVPALLAEQVSREIGASYRVQIDLGPAPSPDPNFPPHAYRIIFDDRSDDPFFILVGPGQFDQILPGREHGKELPLIVYGPGLRVLKRLPGRFRRVAHLPEVG